MKDTCCDAHQLNWDNFNSSLIIEVTRPTGVFTSTGVAIKDDLVLTAAHCLEGDILKIRVFNQATYNPNSPYWSAAQFELHPEYDKKNSNYKSDIARIKLAKKLPTDTMIYPLIKNNKNLTGKFLRVGFGARLTSNTRTLITPEFKDHHPIENTLELNDIFSYSGDSGGPIFIQNGTQMHLVAIHSTLSYGSKGKFSFNPLVADHRDWIFASWK